MQIRPPLNLIFNYGTPPLTLLLGFTWRFVGLGQVVVIGSKAGEQVERARRRIITRVTEGEEKEQANV